MLGTAQPLASHNAADAAWCANKWAVAQRDPKLHDELIAERQALYQQFTLQMHGKNRQRPVFA